VGPLGAEEEDSVEVECEAAEIVDLHLDVNGEKVLGDAEEDYWSDDTL
jgi:hypothetical protein